MKTVGLIGFGKFSQLLLVLLKQQKNIQVKVSSSSKQIDNETFFSFEEVCTCDVIIPCVPISAFEETIITIAKNLSDNALRKRRPLSTTAVIDVCSVKIHPKKTMLKHLPPTINILCTHPNFGPESYRLNGNSTRNLNFIYERIRCNDELFNWFTDVLVSLEVRIIEMTAEQHDRTIGVPHFISMYMGQVLSQLGIQRTEFGAASTHRMFDMIEGVGKDFGILQDMLIFNPYCKDILKDIKSITNTIL